MSGAAGMARETILLHAQHLKNLDKLTDEQAGRLLKSLFALMVDKPAAEMDLATDMLYSIMRDWAENNWQQYDKTVAAKREAGRKGGKAKSSNAKQNLAAVSSAKTARADDSSAEHNGNDNDNENVNDNGSENRDEWTLPYGTYLNVLITADEYSQLCAAWRQEQVDEKIEHLSSYLKQGHDYLNHYVTLRDWLRKDYPEQRRSIGKDAERRALELLAKDKIKIVS